MSNIEEKKEKLIDELKQEWKALWQNRVDDRVRAEGIADKDYALLSVDRGTVIIATRKFKLLDFYEILQQHKSSIEGKLIPPDSSVGGWGRFVRTVLMQESSARRRRQIQPAAVKHSGQQLKKGGRGWLHITD